MLFASYKIFYIFTGIQSQDFQFRKQAVCDELTHPVKETL